MICLLQPLIHRGYPADYLVARIRARWRLGPERFEGGLYRPADAGKGIYWLYEQMEPSLRQHCAPVMAVFELRTLIAAFRHRAVGAVADLSPLLDGSLLHEKVQRALRDSLTVLDAIERITALLPTGERPFRRLSAICRTTGWRGLEPELITCWLEGLSGQASHPICLEFLRDLIDSRNLLVLAKAIRWQIPLPLRFINGGNISCRRLKEAAVAKHLAGISPLLSGEPAPELSVSVIEKSLATAVTEKLRCRARSSEPMAVIFEYLWDCYQSGYATNFPEEGLL